MTAFATHLLVFQRPSKPCDEAEMFVSDYRAKKG
jgi:hypothetical protein